LHIAAKRDEEWDYTSKIGGFAVFLPTGNMTPDFSHSPGRERPNSETQYSPDLPTFPPELISESPGNLLVEFW